MAIIGLFILCLFFINTVSNAQTNPVITSWLRNTTAIKGRHYVANNSTPINDTASANVQAVYYSSNWAYIKTNGVPSYITGPFLGQKDVNFLGMGRWTSCRQSLQ